MPKTLLSGVFLFLIPFAIRAQAVRSEVDVLLGQGRQELIRGDLELAEKDLTAALSRAQKNNDAVRTRIAEESLSSVAEKQNRLDVAEQWLTTELSSFPKGAPVSLSCLSSLANFYSRHQRLEDEAAVLKQIVAVWSSAVGPNALAIAQYQGKLGGVLSRLNNFQDAEAAYRSALSILEKDETASSEATDRVKRNLAGTLTREGKAEEAAQILASVPPAPKHERPDVQPKLLAKQEPKYSDTARKVKMSGSVTLSLEVDETGHPQNIKVVEPLGLGLDQSAIEAVSTWTFQPATKNGVPIRAFATVEVSFRLL